MSAHDNELSLEGRLEHLIADRLGHCEGVPDSVTVVTETGADDATEDDLPEEERGTPQIVVEAIRGEEQFGGKSGVYEMEVEVNLRATDQQLTKRQFSKTFRAISLSIDCAKSHEVGNESIDVQDLKNTQTLPMEYEGAVRSKMLTFICIATAQVKDGGIQYITEDHEHYYVTEDSF